jgi:hypothetical protein
LPLTGCLSPLLLGGGRAGVGVAIFASCALYHLDAPGLIFSWFPYLYPLMIIDYLHFINITGM